MAMKSVWMIVVLAMCVISPSCVEKPKDIPQVSDSQIKESLEKTNRYLANDEEEDIMNYIARHQLDMVASGTGMRYQIMQAGSGELIRPGQTVTLEYVLNNV